VPELRGNEGKYLQECVDTGWVSSVGPFVDRFERAVAERVGARHAVAVVNGTSALHLALLVAGVQPGDEVLVSDLTFIAPANAIRYAGAWPVFMDAERTAWQMDPAKLAEFLSRECESQGGKLVNRASGRRVAAVLPVHILGHTCDMDPILAAARRFGLPVIEDATECLGASYRGRAAGTLGDIGCFSFNGNKLITTGGGGMVVTDNPAWAARVKHLSTQAKADPVEYEHDEVGYNYRLTNIQAALGVAQMELLDEYVAAKRRIAAAYAEALVNVPGITPMPVPPWGGSVFWMYTALVDAGAYGRDRRGLIRGLAERSIQARPLWQPMHASPAHRGCQAYRCEASAWLHGRALSLPCSVGLADEQQKRVVDALRGLQGAK
jgi:perosamine synthetase